MLCSSRIDRNWDPGKRSASNIYIQYNSIFMLQLSLLLLVWNTTSNHRAAYLPVYTGLDSVCEWPCDRYLRVCYYDTLIWDSFRNRAKMLILNTSVSTFIWHYITHPDNATGISSSSPCICLNLTEMLQVSSNSTKCSIEERHRRKTIALWNHHNQKGIASISSVL